jgi:hypothetical protein
MGYRESCKELFMELKILTPSSLYIFALLLFIGNNRDYFVSSSVYHKINTRQRHDLHLPQVSMPCIIREFFIQASKCLTVFPRQLRTSPVSLKSFKLLYTLTANTIILQFRMILQQRGIFNPFCVYLSCILTLYNYVYLIFLYLFNIHCSSISLTY